MSSEVMFKRAWNKLARSTPPGVLVFGLWGLRYSRDWDLRDFADAENLLRIDSNARVLDAGCGPLARAEVYFGSRGFRIVGVDVSAIVASQANTTIKKYDAQKNVDLVVADTEFLPFRERSFDRILAGGLIVHLPTKESAMRALQQFCFCLKTGGLCYIIWLPNLYSFFGPLFKFVTRVGFIGKAERIQLLNFKGLKEIRYICSQAGLEISKVFHGSILWIAIYLFPTFTHRNLKKTIAMLSESNKRHPKISFFPYAFDIIAKKN